MAPEKSPAFQFYPRDFVADLDTASMSLEELGAYVLLLCHGWLKDGLPDDEAQLLRLLQRPRTRGRTLTDVWRVVSAKFPVADDGRRRNARQEEVRSEQSAWRKKGSEHGKRGARARWPECPSNARAMPEQQTNDAQAVGGQSPGNASASASAVPPVVPQEGDAERAWEQWREAWESSGRTALPIEPKRAEADKFIAWAARYPDAEWRALQLRAFFQSENPEVRKSPPSIGWFLAWADEIDLALRKSGRRPSSERAA